MDGMWRKVSGSLWGLWHLPDPGDGSSCALRPSTSLGSLAVHSVRPDAMAAPAPAQPLQTRLCRSSGNLHRLQTMSPSLTFPKRRRSQAPPGPPPSSLSHRSKKRSFRNLFAFSRHSKAKSAERLNGLWVEGESSGADVANDAYLRVEKDGHIVDVCNNFAGLSRTVNLPDLNANAGFPASMSSSCHPDMGTAPWDRSDSPSKRHGGWKDSLRRRLSLSSNPSPLRAPPPPNRGLPPRQQPPRPASALLQPNALHGGPVRTNRAGRSKYLRMEKLGEGSYATVYKCRNILSGTLVALKEIKLQPEEGVPFTAIREASLLKGLRHANIVLLHEIIHEKALLTLVFEYMEKDLSRFLEPYPEGLLVHNAKLLLYQLCRGLAYCHERKILHRDLKPQNLLVNASGELKLADFGLARAASVPSHTYSHEVVTLWYRPPDILLGNTMYTTSLDIWGVGCIFGELLCGSAMFPGTKDVWDQLDKIFTLLGTPSPRSWPRFALLPKWEPGKLRPHRGRGLADVSVKLGGEWGSGCGLLRSMLQPRPEDRISAAEALGHSFFADLPPSLHRLPPFASVFAVPSLGLEPDPPDRYLV